MCNELISGHETCWLLKQHVTRIFVSYRCQLIQFRVLLNSEIAACVLLAAVKRETHCGAEQWEHLHPLPHYTARKLHPLFTLAITINCVPTVTDGSQWSIAFFMFTSLFHNKRSYFLQYSRLEHAMSAENSQCELYVHAVCFMQAYILRAPRKCRGSYTDNGTIPLFSFEPRMKRYNDLSLIPSFSLPGVLCDPTDLIQRKGTPFEAMTSSDGLLAEVF